MVFNIYQHLASAENCIFGMELKNSATDFS